MASLLIIGYGNALRGDDAVGRSAAEQLMDPPMPGVVVESRHQLVPEFVELMKDAARALFIDAAPGTGEPTLQTVTPRSAANALAHVCDAGGLMTLCQTLHGRAPAAWLLTIPGSHFELSEHLSPQAQANVVKALAIARQWCENSL